MSRVVVLGSSGYDLTVRLDRLPRPGETLLGGELHTGPGGKGANQAIAARRAGAEVTFLTAFGDDDFGRQIREHDLAEGLDLSHSLTVPRAANQVALILVGQGGENLIAVAPGASNTLDAAWVDSLPDSVFRGPGAFLACLEIPVEAVARGLARARAGGLTTILNPAPAHRDILDPTLLASVDLLTPNQEELAELSGHVTGTMADALDAVRLLLRTARPGLRVVVTLGEAGAMIVDGDESQRVAAPRVEVVDTVGAGDAFNGALAVALAEGLTLPSSVQRACAAGAFAVTRPGAQGALPTRDQIDRLLADSLE